MQHTGHSRTSQLLLLISLLTADPSPLVVTFLSNYRSACQVVALMLKRFWRTSVFAYQKMVAAQFRKKKIKDIYIFFFFLFQPVRHAVIWYLTDMVGCLLQLLLV